MNRTDKEQLITALNEDLKNAQVAFLTGFRGLGVEELRQLRQEFHKEGVRYKVVKNTLAKRALEGTKFEKLASLFEGPTAIAYTAGEPVTSAKVLRDFVKKNEKLEIKGGALEGKLLNVQAVTALASMPTRDELRATVLAALVAVPQGLVGILSAVPRDFVGVLDAREKQLAE